MSGTMLGTTLEVGGKYRLLWKTPRQRYIRENVMTFLGMSEDGREYFFDAQPLAGTQVIDNGLVRFVLLVERVDRRHEHVLNRVLHNNGGTP